MNSSILTLFLVAVSAVGFSRADTATDDQVAARSDVIDLAGAFQNDGFKIRDGDWFGTISKDHPQIISVNLYSGNAYWFTVATTNKAEKIKLAVFDDQGKPVQYEPYESDNRAAAGFSPDASGLYYVKVSLTEGAPSTFCLIYTYK